MIVHARSPRYLQSGRISGGESHLKLFFATYSHLYVWLYWEVGQLVINRNGGNLWQYLYRNRTLLRQIHLCLRLDGVRSWQQCLEGCFLRVNIRCSELRIFTFPLNSARSRIGLHLRFEGKAFAFCDGQLGNLLIVLKDFYPRHVIAVHRQGQATFTVTSVGTLGSNYGCPFALYRYFSIVHRSHVGETRRPRQGGVGCIFG